MTDEVDFKELADAMLKTADAPLVLMEKPIEGTAPITVNRREYVRRTIAVAFIKVHQELAKAEKLFVSLTEVQS
jgi:hypothetical protein